MNQFDSLAALSVRLNEASDQINNVITHTEEKLRSLNLGVEAWAPSVVCRGNQWRSGQEQLEEFTKLGWAKLKGKWQLVLKRETQRFGFFEGNSDCPYTQTDSTDTVPLRDGSRSERARAIALFSELEASLKQEVQEVLKAVEGRAL